MSESLFLDIIERKIPADIVYETDEVIGFKDINPQAPHHVLFVPKTHVRTINDLQEDQAALVGALFLAAKAYAEELGESDYRVVMNCGEQAGQSVWHIHLHFLAGRALGWPPG
ncbi:MAG: histidine triad nucleotide-binding protein [Xanthomonadales bacterium]|nr:histidine triad nucleotide-binding protein [Xanthomonadales bacterium]